MAVRLLKHKAHATSNIFRLQEILDIEAILGMEVKIFMQFCQGKGPLDKALELAYYSAPK